MSEREDEEITEGESPEEERRKGGADEDEAPPDDISSYPEGASTEADDEGMDEIPRGV